MAASFDSAFARVKELATDFKANEKFFLSPQYQEAEARRDFIDKFLLALGWDVNHDTQKNPYEQEVKVERKEHGVSQRRADYAFYLAPNFRDVKFYIEAKKPFGDIATTDNYFQTIRYGWNSHTPVAVLFDFEQFEIVDCRFKPDLETALQRNLKKFHYSQFSDKEQFAEIYWLFSREAVADGSLEKYAEKLPKKHGAVQRGLFKGGYQSFDEAFLEELDAHRNTLAHVFKNSKPTLDGETLTEVTQRTLDRLVFIRFLEDKLIEPEYLVAKFGERGSAWGDFIAASRRLDGIYNGIVFKKHNILDSPAFKVDDGQFGGICEDLCHINSPYDFNAIPIHILGSIYERFLGKVIVTTDKRAQVRDKPEVRKAGGVYYTPEYIVRYIVESTVGKLIAGKTPGQIAEMKFADIACGSGSFLLGVYDLLIRYHTKFYNDNPRKAKKGETAEREDGLHLTLQKKREILVNNIFGVDIDNQAVEVAQLSLYLKLLQDETPASARGYQMEFHETLLPSLNKNIVCGNSLIGTDISSGSLFVLDDEMKLNPMDYEQRFPEIIKRGGFDAIVGNPPYIHSRSEHVGEPDKEYYQAHYEVAEYQLNTFALFLERGLKTLKKNGKLGYIVPNYWLSTKAGQPLRHFLFIKNNVIELLNVYRVFTEATVDTIVIIVERAGIIRFPKTFLVKGVDRMLKTIPDRLQAVFEGRWAFEKHTTIKSEADANNIELSSQDAFKLKGKTTVGSFLSLSFGMKAYQVGKGKPPQTRKIVDEKGFDATAKKNSNYRKLLRARNVKRYFLKWQGDWINYGEHLAEPRRPELFRGERILIQRIVSGQCLDATLTDEDFICNTDVTTLKLLDNSKSGFSIKYFLSILCSKLCAAYLKQRNINLDRDAFPKINTKTLEGFPLPNLNLVARADKSRHDKMVSMVEQMLAAKKQLAGAQSDKEKDFYENKCASLDRQIDALVYELYGLTAAEIKIVEGAAA